METESKYKRKLKELKYQNACDMLETLKAYKKNWSKTSLHGGGCIITMSTLGKTHGFELYINGESFDNFVKPALQKALEETLKAKRDYMKTTLMGINKEIGEE